MLELDDFDKELGGVMCYHCRHLNEAFPLQCEAFPDGISSEVWHSTHTERYPGDRGIVFEELSDEEMEARRARMGRKESVALAK